MADESFKVTIDIKETIDVKEKSLFELLKGLGKSDCQAFLDNGDALVNASSKAEQSKDWNNMFYYDEEAFYTYLRAFGHCDDEPENKEKAKSRLDEHQIRSRILACVYHITNAKNAYQRSTLALDQFEDPYQSLRHAKLSSLSLNDSEKFCEHNPKTLKIFEQLKTLVSKTIVTLEKYIEEHSQEDT